MPPRTGPDAKGYRLPQEPPPLTAGHCLAQDWSLSVYCATCRVMRRCDLVDLSIRKPAGDIRKMRFRCNTCGAPGRAQVAIDTPSHRVVWEAR
jgi:hypothetical protein